MNHIKLDSRYGDVYLEERFHAGNTITYLLKMNNGDYIRAGFDDAGITFIDPPGGPLLKVGERLPEANNRVILAIEGVKDVGFYVTLSE